MLKVPKINWIPFDKNNPPFETCPNEKYFILIREGNYDDGVTWHYSVDVAEPWGTYLDDFWDTENDWYEGQRVEVVAYVEFPYYLKECALMEVE